MDKFWNIYLKPFGLNMKVMGTMMLILMIVGEGWGWWKQLDDEDCNDEKLYVPGKPSGLFVRQ